MPNRRACSTATRVREPRSRQASISGGSSDSEATAFAVAPAGPAGPIAVTTVTAVGKPDIAARRVAGSIWVGIRASRLAVTRRKV